jgi:hypothetical protein
MKNLNLSVKSPNISLMYFKRNAEYEKWLNEFLKPLSGNEIDKLEKEKITFESFFPVSTIIKFNVNNLDYKLFLNGA